MSNRPTRVSHLAGTSASRPSYAPQDVPEPVDAPHGATGAVAPTEPPTGSPNTQPGQSAKAEKAEKVQVGFYMLPENLRRARRAHTGTALHTETRFWSAFLEEAVMEHTKRLEQQYNDSTPF